MLSITVNAAFSRYLYDFVTSQRRFLPEQIGDLLTGGNLGIPRFLYFFFFPSNSALEPRTLAVADPGSGQERQKYQRAAWAGPFPGPPAGAGPPLAFPPGSRALRKRAAEAQRQPWACAPSSAPAKPLLPERPKV